MTRKAIQSGVKLLLGVLLIIIISLWVYRGSTDNQFVWDSVGYLFVYEFWISSLKPFHVLWMFLSLEMANWHPVTWLSWAIDYQIYGGLDPWGFHFTNNLLHALNSGLMFVLALTIFGLNKPGNDPSSVANDHRALVAALVAALLFAVHPQHVESVAWVAERKDLLCQFFLLLSTLAYVRYVQCAEPEKTLWFRTSLTLFIVAILAKPMAVTFPVVLLLLDVYPIRRSPMVASIKDSIKPRTIHFLLKEKIPFITVSLLSVIITLQAQTGAMTEVALEIRVLNAFNSIILYLDKLLIPFQFSPHYPYFILYGEGISWPDFLPIVIFAAISLICIYAWTKAHHAWLISWLFYLITLSPILGIIQVGIQGAADRYAYLPTIPAYLLAGGALLGLFKKTNVKARFLLFLLNVPLLVFLGSKTIQQIEVWEDEFSLWYHTVELYPQDLMAHLNLGINHLNIADFEKAAIHFEEAGKLQVIQTDVLAWRGVTYLQLGRLEEALSVHIQLGLTSEKIPELQADQYCIQYNIGWIYAHLGMNSEAAELFSRVDPNSERGEDARIWLGSLNHQPPPGRG